MERWDERCNRFSDLSLLIEKRWPLLHPAGVLLLGHIVEASSQVFSVCMVMHLLAVGAASLLTPPRPGVGQRVCRHSEVRMGMFDGLAAAFANDDTLGEKKGVATKTMRTITWRDPKGVVVSSQAIPGQKLKDIARQDGIGPIKYSCNEVRTSLGVALSSPSATPLSPGLGRAPRP